MNKRLLKLTAAFTIVGCLTGCWNSRELDTLSVLIGVGIDKTDDFRMVNVTAQIANPSNIKTSEDREASSQEAYWNLQMSAENVFVALRDCTFSASRKLYIGQNQIILLGEDLAKAGLQKYMDFFLRDPEARLNEYVVVAKGKAADILDVKPELEKLPALNIQNLIDIHFATSQVVSIRLIDFSSAIASGTTSAVAPMIEIDGFGEDKKLKMSGTAVFKDYKLAGELDPFETRGYLWVVDKVKSGVLNVSSKNGETALEIIRSKSKMTPVLKDDGSFSIKLSVKTDVNLGSQEGWDDFLLSEDRTFVENRAAKAIESDIMACLDKAGELGTDIFGFGEAIRRKYPRQWNSVKDDWENIFPDIEVELETNVKLRGTGEFIRSVFPERG